VSIEVCLAHGSCPSLDAPVEHPRTMDYGTIGTYLQAMEVETGIATSELVAQYARLHSQDTTDGDHPPVYVAC
jgi:hypothetical protein